MEGRTTWKHNASGDYVNGRIINKQPRTVKKHKHLHNSASSTISTFTWLLPSGREGCSYIVQPHHEQPQLASQNHRATASAPARAPSSWNAVTTCPLQVSSGQCKWSNRICFWHGSLLHLHAQLTLTYWNPTYDMLCPLFFFPVIPAFSLQFLLHLCLPHPVTTF